MKNILKALKEVFIVIFQILFLPIIDCVDSLLKNFYDEKNILTNKVFIFTKNTFDKIYSVTLVVYYLLLLLTQIVAFFQIVSGKISCLDFRNLLIVSFAILIFNIVFVHFLNTHFKLKKTIYIIYFQLLFFLPILIVYWIACIEGHEIFLINLNADQWISVFNNMIIYLSGCIIGISNLYRADTIKAEEK